MRLQIHTVHFDADAQLTEFVQKKVDKLETFFDRIIEGEVFLRHNNDDVANKTAEIKLYVPGATLFSKEEAPSFEAAADAAVEAMRRQLKRYKEKSMSY